MTKGEKILCFVAQALGGATLWGAWVQFAGVPLFVQEAHTARLLLISLAALLLLTLVAKLSLSIRYASALLSLGKSYLSGVLKGFAIAALILLLTELMTALVGMMTLMRYGG